MHGCQSRGHLVPVPKVKVFHDIWTPAPPFFHRRQHTLSSMKVMAATTRPRRRKHDARSRSIIVFDVGGAQRVIEFRDYDIHRQSFQKFLNRSGLSSV